MRRCAAAAAANAAAMGQKNNPKDEEKEAADRAKVQAAIKNKGGELPEGTLLMCAWRDGVMRMTRVM